jgi:hypothetical protein
MSPHWLTIEEMAKLGTVLERSYHTTRHAIGWVFWDETGAYGCGPFETKEAAESAILQYARYI